MVSRILTFEFITDDRFPEKYGNDILSKIKEYVKRLENVLIEKQATYEIYPIFELTFTHEGTTNKQQRCRFYVHKIKGMTWNDHYKMVNAIQACRYKLI